MYTLWGSIFPYFILFATARLFFVAVTSSKYGVRCALDCGQEAACTFFPNNTYGCICPHDSSVPTADLKCPRSIVPVEPSKLKVLPPPTVEVLGSSTLKTVTNFATMDAAKDMVSSSWWDVSPQNFHEGFILAIFCATTVVMMAVYFKAIKNFMRCWNANFKAVETDSNEIFGMEEAPIAGERYVGNPSYEVNGTFNITGTFTPIDFPGYIVYISRNAITSFEEVGEGQFGKVYRGQLHVVKEDGMESIETVAVKMLKPAATPEAEEDFAREVEIVSSFHHPNILTLLGVCPREGDQLPMMVFEYMPFGDLNTLLRNSSREMWKSVPALPVLKENSLLFIASQIAEGMEYLACQRFVHRDLACRNCLVGTDFIVKIADFGMSRDVYTCDYYKVGGTRLLPVRWMSPESIMFGKFTLESDVWSYGVVLWEIYNYAKQPYFGYSNEQALQLVLSQTLLEIPDNCPEQVADLMRGCWKIDPKERLNFLDICNTLSELKNHNEKNTMSTLPRPPKQTITIEISEIDEHEREHRDEKDDDDADEDIVYKDVQLEINEEEIRILGEISCLYSRTPSSDSLECIQTLPEQ